MTRVTTRWSSGMSSRGSSRVHSTVASSSVTHDAYLLALFERAVFLQGGTPFPGGGVR